MKSYSLWLGAIGGLMAISLATAGLEGTSTIAQSSLQGVLQENSSLSPVSLDESVEETSSDRFSMENSLERLQQIRGALSSFQRLTDESRGVLGEGELNQIGNTDWEIQNLGFPNWTNAVEGTLKQQDYQIKKLEFELAQKQYDDGEISQVILAEKEAAYQRSEQEFQQFWESFQIAD